ncbi:hypothetical protein A2U01_0070702, partial [Trifolium medium]|nr:hypothetical protein [Trifolium medium]
YTVPPTVHLKMKYHGKKNGVVTIEADMIGAKKCHNTMQKAISTAAEGHRSKATPMETLLVKEKQKLKYHG